MCTVELGHTGEWYSLFSLNIVLCPFSHIFVTNSTSLYVLVQDVSIPNTRRSYLIRRLLKHWG
jgi:hypothetical protein